MDYTFGELKETALGTISLMAGKKGLQRISFGSLKLLKSEMNLTMAPPSFKGLEIIGSLLIEINEYLFGIRKNFTVDIDWGVMDGFQFKVLKLVTKIPYGEVWTYGEIARSLGNPKAARAVGRALAKNPMPLVIPCHRVIGSNGRLRGYASPEGIVTKAFLLGLEGHSIEGDRIII